MNTYKRLLRGSFETVENNYNDLLKSKDFMMR